jgi:hypothetical protein
MTQQSPVACDFDVVEYGEKKSQVLCRNCGRTVRVATSTIGRVHAICRGNAETRWYRDGTPRPRPTDGPGSELKKLLAAWPFRIIATPNCSCSARARLMDQQGCNWCEANIDTIVGWLREEATKRRLPFLDAAGRLLVKRAIRNARKAAG